MKITNLKQGLLILAAVLFVANEVAAAQVKSKKAPGKNPSETVTVTLVRWPYT